MPDSFDDKSVVARKVKKDPDLPGEPSSERMYFAVRDKR